MWIRRGITTPHVDIAKRIMCSRSIVVSYLCWRLPNNLIEDVFILPRFFLRDFDLMYHEEILDFHSRMDYLWGAILMVWVYRKKCRNTERNGVFEAVPFDCFTSEYTFRVGYRGMVYLDAGSMRRVFRLSEEWCSCIKYTFASSTHI